ncbi:MAG: cereblon family protein [Sulfuricaulis sp.]
MSAAGWLFFDPLAEKKRSENADTRRAEKTKKENRLFCAACRRPVTNQNERIQVQGGHEHRCTNPHGIEYHIGCFREAGGCTAIGEATLEYTWFTGYAWRIALCAHCHVHLGWRFEASGEYFHALIGGRLTSAGPA